MRTIVRITVLEAARRRLLWALVVLTVVTVGLTGWGFERLVTLARAHGASPPDPLGAVGYLAAEALVLLSIALVLGTRLPAIASGAIVVVIYGLTWVAGVMGAVGAFFNTPALVQAAEASRVVVPIDGLWRGA